MLDRLRQDLRYASRSLSRSPIFTLVSIVSIAVGIGATTAIVTLANTLLLSPPPGVGHPGRLVMLGRTQDGHGFDTFSYPTFQEFSAAQSLAGAAALDLEPKAVSLIGPSGGEPMQVTAVSGSMFAVLEARPGLGRFFTPEDDRPPGGNPVVVLSHKFWERHFNADSSIVGRTIVMNRSPFTVIGVARER
ncbi:MAG TPA: ABC transporter permease, partial [Gemmatimonadales bacterium]|nr:ABC transporter permease [Gemmatimonadales bacterium]